MKYAVVTIIGMMVIGGCITLHCTDHHAEPETAPAYDNLVLDDLVVEVPQKMLVRGKFQRETQRTRVWIRSGMPCDLYQGEEYEQETSEETSQETCQTGSEHDGVLDAPVVCERTFTVAETVPQTVCSTESVCEEIQTVSDTCCESEVPTNGEQNDRPTGSGLEDYLRQCLEAAGIGWWYPYACAQITQESHWNPYAENPNGLDKGLLQYRITFYPGQNIFDPYEQIRIYVGQVSARINAGLGVEAVISRHITSDWVTEINWEYVKHVLSHMQ